MKLDILSPMEWGFFTLPRPCVIAGPCSAESMDQVLETAAGLKRIGINMYRAGIWKPRTHPGSFEGHGAPALKWLQEVKKRYGMKVGCEVASAQHVFECVKHGVDMVWLGARTTANPFLVQEIAEALEGMDIPVLVKNPVNPDLDLWIGAFERLNKCGIRKLGAIHRGVSSSQKLKYRNDPAWDMAIQLRSRVPELPIFCDPSHMAGSTEYIQELSQRALDLGFEGLMIETHCNPSCALSDAKQQLTPDQLYDLLLGPDKLVVRDNDTDNVSYRENMTQLRAKIDVLDENIISLLAQRMNVSRQIGQFKKDNNIAILQTGRWEEVLAGMVARGTEAGLSESFVRAVFDDIHEESVALQNKILED